MLLEIHERQIQPDIVVVELSGKLALGRESQRVESMLHDLVQSGAVADIKERLAAYLAQVKSSSKVK
jgi:hypothetical protein